MPQAGASFRERRDRNARHFVETGVGHTAMAARAFRVAMTGPVGTKRGRGRGSLIDSGLDGIDTLYAETGESARSVRGAPEASRPSTDSRIP